MIDQTPTDTLYIGGLDQRVTRRILYDLCIQVKCCWFTASRQDDTDIGYPHLGRRLLLNVEDRCRLDVCCTVIQAGPVVRVHIPEEAGIHRGYAFCQFTSVVRIYLCYRKDREEHVLLHRSWIICL